MSGAVHVWSPPADVRAAGELARHVVRHAGSTAVAQGVQEPVFPSVDEARRVLVERLAGVPSVGAVRSASGGLPATDDDPHRNGYGIDVMIRDGVVAGQTRPERGDAIANFFVRHASRLGVQYVLWSRYEWSASGRGAAWEAHTGSNPHVDHVHVEFGPEARRWSRELMRARIAEALDGDAGNGWLMLVGVAGLAALAVGLVRWAGVR